MWASAILSYNASLLDRLQSVLHAAARLVNGSSKYDHVTSLLQDLHWLRVPERIKYRLAVLIFRCRNNTAPEHLARDNTGSLTTTLGDACDRQRHTS